MPKVDKYTIGQVQKGVVRQPLMVNTSQDYSPIYQGASDLVNSTIKMQDRISTTAAEEALINFNKGKNELFFNPEKGYFNTKGKNAYEGSDIVRKGLEELKKENAKNLSGIALDKFNKAADAHIMKADTDIMRHSSQGLKTWEIATQESQVEDTLESATLYWNQPETVKINMAIGEQAVVESSNMSGIGAEATNEKLQTYHSKFASAVILGALNKSYKEGQEKYKEYESLLEPSDKTSLQNSLQSQKKNQETKYIGAESINIASKLNTSYDNRADMISEIQKIKNPLLRSKAMDETMKLYKFNDQAKKEEQASIYEEAEKFILNGGTVSGYQVENPDNWNKLSAKEQTTLTGSNGSVTTDWITYGNLRNLTNEELAKINPVDYYSRLAIPERKEITTLVNKARNSAKAIEKDQLENKRTIAIADMSDEEITDLDLNDLDTSISKSVLNNIISRRAKIIENRGNDEQFTNYINLINEPIDKFLAIDPLSYKDKVSKSQYLKLSERYQTQGQSQSGRTRVSQTKDTVDILFGKEKDWNDEQRENVNSFYNMVDEETKRRETELGRELTSSEYTDVLAGFSRQVVIENKYWFDETNDFTDMIKDIPKEDVSEVMNYLKSINKPITVDNIYKVYEMARED